MTIDETRKELKLAKQLLRKAKRDWGKPGAPSLSKAADNYAYWLVKVATHKDTQWR